MDFVSGEGRKALRTGTEIDRISNLSDRILIYILSFLPTIYVVRTGILSNRWRNLWTFSPNLYFDSELLHFSSPSTKLYVKRNKSMKPELDDVRRNKFMNSVEKVLHCRNSSIILRNFHLICSPKYGLDQSLVCQWLIAAVGSEVEELYLSFLLFHHDFHLPDCVFTCKSLTVLKLNLHDSYVKLPNIFHLPQLKTLHLIGGEHNYVTLFHKLLSGCPILENFAMEHCIFSGFRVLEISSPALKSLTIQYVDWVGDPSDSFIIRISSPGILSLNYSGFTSVNLENLLSPSDASIDIWGDKFCDTKAVTGVFLAVLRARTLTIGAKCIELLTTVPDLVEFLPTFHELSHLKISVCIDSDTLCVIPCLLHNSPNLKTLIIDFSEDDMYRRCSKKKENLMSLKYPCDCPLHHLKVVHINNFEGGQEELQLVKILLKNALFLERMVITRTGDLENLTEIRDSLLMFPKASPTSTISFP